MHDTAAEVRDQLGMALEALHVANDEPRPLAATRPPLANLGRDTTQEQQEQQDDGEGYPAASVTPILNVFGFDVVIVSDDVGIVQRSSYG